ncbi:MAG: hypothetical protein FRX48_00369 [Lasallia pustulata]|uniref:tyrosinase n=1 Tax=Lasallia pustulata TaxID=136370 RepID=A0A5M8Q395_9LECA|nr:MAG: hypothetical protein FRX48_00369 [Lasallia pustulata]
MALFEQLLWNHAQVIAEWYPAATRSQYQAAAQTFRVPYWDWASSAEMPSVVSQPTITITSPQGPKATPNPLYNYTFHPQPSAFDFPPRDSITAYQSTVRYPDASGHSQPDLINQQLSANAQALQSMTYQLLAQQPNYGPFSNTAYRNGTNQIFNSLENMHNAIHGLVGNGGHMSIVPYAGFDPIFWLHHANVDRLFAMWQAIYPGSYTTPQSDAYGTFTNSPGGIEDIKTLLTPFHSDNSGTLYTSATARSISSFGYTYPEIQDWNVTTTQLSANVRSAINALYSPSSTPSKQPRTNDPASSSPTPPDHQWFVNILVTRNALPTGYFIHFFLSPPPPPQKPGPPPPPSSPPTPSSSRNPPPIQPRPHPRRPNPPHARPRRPRLRGLARGSDAGLGDAAADGAAGVARAAV